MNCTIMNCKRSAGDVGELPELFLSC